MAKRMVWAIFVAVVVCLAPLGAQTTSGEIVGTVTDATGGVVAGAGITVTNMNTGIAVKATTDTSGNYVVTSLGIGRYSVTVEATGFKKSLHNELTLNVQDRLRVDAVLEVGSVNDTVEVQASAPMLETDTSSLGQVVDSQRIVDLPLNGRYFTRLAVLTAGTAPTVHGARDENSGGFTSNGVRPFQNNYLLDGVDNNSLSEDLVSQQSFVIGPAPDAIAEFKVQTNSMSAEFGRSGGAVLNVTIKSGTNQLHGTLYEFLRNSALDAKNFFDDPASPIPPFKQNQFGFSVGGPVLIPKIYDGRNRTFFFFDYQGTRIRIGQTLFASVPPDAWRTGNFAGYNTIFEPGSTTTDANGNSTRTPFPGNQIPSSMFNPIAAKLLSMFPEPNVLGQVSTFGVSNNYLSSPSEPNDTDQFDVRIDHRISDSDSIFGRFSYSNNTDNPPGPIPPPLDAASFSSGNFINRPRNAVLSETHIFNPRIVNEFRLGYSRNRSERLQFDANENLSAQLGIPGIPFSTNNGGLPQFTVNGLNTFGSSEYQPTVETQEVYHIIDSVSIIFGRHTLKVGAELKPRVNFSILQPPVPRGAFGFTGQFTNDPNNPSNTGLGTADFLLGVVQNAQIGSFINDVFQQPGQFYYVQDDFKVSKKLTLNLGMRYEYVVHAREKYNAEANFNIDTNTLDIASGRQDPLPADFYPEIAVNRNASRSLVPNQKHDFGPRIGFAYNMFKNTVLRGGYGVFYSSYEAGPLSIPNPGNNPPFFEQANYNAISAVQVNPIVGNLSQGFPANALTNPSLPSLFSLDPHFTNPNVQHWQLSVQHELPWNMVWEVAYAGSKGDKLYEFRNANAVQPSADPNANYQDLRLRPYLSDLPLWCSCNSSTYHSMQTKVEKRLSNGLSFLTAFTYGKSIDEVSTASLGFHGGGYARDWNHPEEEKGPSDFDQKFRFVNSVSYSLPFGKGKKFLNQMNAVGNAIIGGWELQGIQSYTSGVPLTIQAANGESNTDGDSEERPNRVLGTPLYPSSQSASLWFNPAAFVATAFGTLGNAGRNIIYTQPQVGIDSSLFKDFAITERAKLQFRSEFFNMINHPNFRANSLNNYFDSPGAGVYSAANPARQIQFALKVIF